MRYLLIAVLVVIIGCTDEKPFYSEYLSANEIDAQIITINNQRDTTVRGKKGAVLHIKSGSFSGEAAVALQLKEVYTLPEIIRGGLFTRTTEGKPLSSGGMIYLKPVDEERKLVKPIDVSIPTQAYDPGMKHYTGKEVNGIIEWQDSVPLAYGPSAQMIADGRQLFAQNCKTCHDVQKKLTGPALAHFESRGPWADRAALYRFIHNPSDIIASNNYMQCQQSQYGVIMQAFPRLGEQQIDAIVRYINAETTRLGIPAPAVQSPLCADSSRRYDSARAVYLKLQEERGALIDANGKRILYQRNGVPPSRDTVGPPTKVVPEEHKAIYYQFEIESVGWHNIDRLLDFDAAANSRLAVMIDESVSKEFDVFIAVPQYRVFDRGGLLKSTTKSYGFFTEDGRVPLPMGTKVWVFAIGEAEGKILFDSKQIVAGATEEVRLQPKLFTKEVFLQQIASLGMQDITVTVTDTKNSEAIREKDAAMRTQQQTSEAIKPVNCTCDCEEQWPVDSTIRR